MVRFVNKTNEPRNKISFINLEQRKTVVWKGRLTVSRLKSMLCSLFKLNFDEVHISMLDIKNKKSYNLNQFIDIAPYRSSSEFRVFSHDEKKVKGNQNTDKLRKIPNRPISRFSRTSGGSRASLKSRSSKHSLKKRLEKSVAENLHSSSTSTEENPKKEEEVAKVSRTSSPDSLTYMQRRMVGCPTITISPPREENLLKATKKSTFGRRSSAKRKKKRQREQQMQIKPFDSESGTQHINYHNSYKGAVFDNDKNYSLNPQNRRKSRDSSQGESSKGGHSSAEKLRKNMKKHFLKKSKSSVYHANGDNQKGSPDPQGGYKNLKKHPSDEINSKPGGYRRRVGEEERESRLGHSSPRPSDGSPATIPKSNKTADFGYDHKRQMNGNAAQKTPGSCESLLYRNNNNEKNTHISSISFGFPEQEDKTMKGSSEYAEIETNANQTITPGMVITPYILPMFEYTESTAQMIKNDKYEKAVIFYVTNLDKLNVFLKQVLAELGTLPSSLFLAYKLVHRSRSASHGSQHQQAKELIEKCVFLLKGVEQSFVPLDNWSTTTDQPSGGFKIPLEFKRFFLMFMQASNAEDLSEGKFDKSKMIALLDQIDPPIQEKYKEVIKELNTMELLEVDTMLKVCYFFKMQPYLISYTFDSYLRGYFGIEVLGEKLNNISYEINSSCLEEEIRMVKLGAGQGEVAERGNVYGGQKRPPRVGGRVKGGAGKVSRKKLENIKEEMTIKDLEPEGVKILTEIYDSKETDDIIKGIAKFYLNLNEMISKDLLKFPSVKRLNEMQTFLRETFDNLITSLLHEDYRNLENSPEINLNLKELEKEFSHYGSIHKFMQDLQTLVIISNQDIHEDNRDVLTLQTTKNKHATISNMMNQIKSETTFSDNAGSPNPLVIKMPIHEGLKAVDDTKQIRNVRKYSGGMDRSQQGKYRRSITVNLNQPKSAVPQMLKKGKKSSLQPEHLGQINVSEIIKQIKEAKVTTKKEGHKHSLKFRYTFVYKELVSDSECKLTPRLFRKATNLLFHEDPNMISILKSYMEGEDSIREIYSHLQKLAHKFDGFDCKAGGSETKQSFKDSLKFLKEVGFITKLQESNFLYLFNEDELKIVSAYEVFNANSDIMDFFENLSIIEASSIKFNKRTSIMQRQDRRELANISLHQKHIYNEISKYLSSDRLRYLDKLISSGDTSLYQLWLDKGVILEDNVENFVEDINNFLDQQMIKIDEDTSEDNQNDLAESELLTHKSSKDKKAPISVKSHYEKSKRSTTKKSKKTGKSRKSGKKKKYSYSNLKEKKTTSLILLDQAMRVSGKKNLGKNSPIMYSTAGLKQRYELKNSAGRFQQKSEDTLKSQLQAVQGGKPGGTGHQMDGSFVSNLTNLLKSPIQEDLVSHKGDNESSSFEEKSTITDFSNLTISKRERKKFEEFVVSEKKFELEMLHKIEEFDPLFYNSVQKVFALSNDADDLLETLQTFLKLNKQSMQIEELCEKLLQENTLTEEEVDLLKMVADSSHQASNSGEEWIKMAIEIYEVSEGDMEEFLESLKTSGMFASLKE